MQNRGTDHFHDAVVSLKIMLYSGQVLDTRPSHVFNLVLWAALL